MYTGDDNYVGKDEPVRDFVARALDRKAISAGYAANLVREPACEKPISPRYPACRTWRYGVALAN